MNNSRKFVSEIDADTCLSYLEDRQKIIDEIQDEDEKNAAMERDPVSLDVLMDYLKEKTVDKTPDVAGRYIVCFASPGGSVPHTFQLESLIRYILDAYTPPSLQNVSENPNAPGTFKYLKYPLTVDSYYFDDNMYKRIIEKAIKLQDNDTSFLRDKETMEILDKKGVKSLQDLLQKIDTAMTGPGNSGYAISSALNTYNYEARRAAARRAAQTAARAYNDGNLSNNNLSTSPSGYQRRRATPNSPTSTTVFRNPSTPSTPSDQIVPNQTPNPPPLRLGGGKKTGAKKPAAKKHSLAQKKVTPKKK